MPLDAGDTPARKRRRLLRELRYAEQEIADARRANTVDGVRRRLYRAIQGLTFAAKELVSAESVESNRHSGTA